MKNKNFFESIKCAVIGMIKGFRAEKNFKIYCVIAAIFLLFNILLSVGKYDYIILILLSSAVFSAEYINTTVERVVDKFGEGIHDDYRFIKDVSAGAVLVNGIAFFLVEAIILIPRLFR